MKYLISMGVALLILLPGQPAWSAQPEVPNFSAMAATSRSTRAIEKKDLLGKVWVADFIFTTCGDICPRMTRQMRKLQSHLPKEVYLVSFSIDPDKDTLQDLQGYARDADADPDRWSFVRMGKKPLAQLLVGFKLAKNEKAALENSAALSHSSRFVVVDRRGQIRGFYD